MAAEKRIEILESFRKPWPGSRIAGELASDADNLPTVWLRPKTGGELDVARAIELGSTLPQLARTTNAGSYDAGRTRSPAIRVGSEPSNA